MMTLLAVGLGAVLFMAAAVLKARSGCGGACHGCENACARESKHD
jgi:hypothetical protein